MVPHMKTEAEQILEQVERGATDRADRLAAEARQAEAAQRAAQQAEVLATDRSLRLLIAKHASLHQQFDAELTTLAGTAARLMALEAQIDELRQTLYEGQRGLGAAAFPLPSLNYTQVDIFARVHAALRR